MDTTKLLDVVVFRLKGKIWTIRLRLLNLSIIERFHHLEEVRPTYESKNASVITSPKRWQADGHRSSEQFRTRALPRIH